MYDCYVVLVEDTKGIRHCMMCFHTFEGAVEFIKMQGNNVRSCGGNEYHWIDENDYLFMIEELTFGD